MAFSVLSLSNILTLNRAWSKNITGAVFLVYLASFIWLIVGIVLRFRHIGKVCAGDFAEENGVTYGNSPYQWQSGKFMKVYIYAVLSIIGTTAILGGISLFIVYFCFV